MYVRTMTVLQILVHMPLATFSGLGGQRVWPGSWGDAGRAGVEVRMLLCALSLTSAPLFALTPQGVCRPWGLMNALSV